MDEMREIVTVAQVDRWFLLLAVGLPVVGALVGALIGSRRGAVTKGASRGLLVGLLGPTNLLLWTVYNRLTDSMGLDSVKNLLVNITLFIGLGLTAGVVYGLLSRRGNQGSDSEPAQASAPEPQQ
jgi:hypothetical protein